MYINLLTHIMLTHLFKQVKLTKQPKFAKPFVTSNVTSNMMPNNFTSVDVFEQYKSFLSKFRDNKYVSNGVDTATYEYDNSYFLYGNVVPNVNIGFYKILNKYKISEVCLPLITTESECIKLKAYLDFNFDRTNYVTFLTNNNNNFGIRKLVTYLSDDNLKNTKFSLMEIKCDTPKDINCEMKNIKNEKNKFKSYKNDIDKDHVCFLF